MKNFILGAALCLFLCPALSYAHTLAAGFDGFEDPQKCAGCHADIYKEWSESMHAKSSVFDDPIHASVYTTFYKSMAAAGKPGPYFCAGCHTPTADNMAKLMGGEARPDQTDVTNSRGVTCSFCHKADGLVEGEKIHAYRLTGGIKGPSGKGAAPHKSAYSRFASSFEVCMGCHGKMINAKGAVVCSADEEGYSDCLTCHMKDADGAPAAGSAKKTHASHAIFGAHDPATLRQGAVVTLGSEMGKLLVIIKNPNPHSFPSTNPMRAAYVKVEIFDASGKTLFTNFEKDPSEDPKALFVKVFKAGDKVGVPSWEADGIAKDTRLAAGETRDLTYDIPAGAAKATAKLFYRFVPAAALDKYGIPHECETAVKAHPVSEAEISLK